MKFLLRAVREVVNLGFIGMVLLKIVFSVKYVFGLAWRERRRVNSWSEGKLRITHLLFIVCGWANHTRAGHKEANLRYRKLIRTSQEKMCIRMGTEIPLPTSSSSELHLATISHNGCTKGIRLARTFTKIVRLIGKSLKVTECKSKGLRTLDGCQFLLFISQMRANPIPLWSLGFFGATMKELPIGTAQF